MRVQPFDDSAQKQHSSSKQNASIQKRKRRFAFPKNIPLLQFLGVVAVLGLFAVAVVVPLMYSLNSSKNATTNSAVNTTTTTGTTMTSLTTTTATTTTVTTTTVTTTTTTITTTTTRLLQWNTTSLTVAGDSGGTTGSALNLLYNPMGIALDSSNGLYIADFQNHRISKWIIGASNGTIMAGQPNRTSGASNNTLNGPFCVILDSSSNMYIADFNNHRVMYWPNGSSYGSVIAGITGSPGSANNQLNYPTGLARDSTTGTLYIADANNNRIMQYLSGASSGTVVAGGNGAGTGSTQLYSPYSIVFNSSANSLTIVNNGAHNVVRWVIGASGWTIVAGSASGVSGNTSTLLYYPHNVAADQYGNIYVSDTSNHRVQFFLAGQSNATTAAGITGVPGVNATLLNQPYWVILDSQFSLYVSDTNNNRVQKYP